MSFRGRMEIQPGQTVLWTDGQKILGKNPWQQSHDLKIVLVGFLVFILVFVLLHPEFVTAARSLGILTEVWRKVTGVFLCLSKAC